MAHRVVFDGERLTLRQHFWRLVARFAYRRLMKGRPQRLPPDGLPGIRDPDSRCDIYEPRKRELGDFNDCQGDGHYLCQECCHLINHRRHDYVPTEDDDE